MKQFLSSTWKNTFIVTWEIEPELLIEYIPHKLGLHTQKGKTFLSFILYNFENTKVRGIKMPFHVSFAEIDLRFYIQHQQRLGVGFVQHLVPRYCVSLWAKRIFNENYLTLPIEYSAQETETSKVVHYTFWKNKNKFSVDFLTNKETQPNQFPLLNQVQYGYGSDKYGNPIQFKFDKQNDYFSYTSLDYSIQVDFAVLFGKKWSFLNYLEPIHVQALTDNKIRIFQPEWVYRNDNLIENYVHPNETPSIFNENKS